ncbi:rRNA methylase [Serpentinimonas maccroryi]|uniref:rRNA methylase n=1 Tax=Serpentinimonas maccroryi TaxID=1458426 RepID=A0A060NP45_9BURK|nr:RNA methyltransferase [Serpentinimonas maccroryi]BAO83542.1 rRNA methylase [Serpentinimonas maccroryi]
MNTETIRSRDNALLKQLRRLANDPAAGRELGLVWLEGEHLCRALLARGQLPTVLLRAESAPHWDTAWSLPPSVRRVALADSLLAGVSGLGSSAPVGFLWPLPAAAACQPGRPTVLLDRLQDPGNVGSILRSAAALGIEQVLALKGTAALWAPKVLRAGMGAHFGLRLVEGLHPDDLAGLDLPLLATSSHQGQWLHQAALPWPCAWLFGHEGQGVSPALLAAASHTLRIAQPGGEESLNVAAAAAICLHASAVQRLG